MTEALFPDLTPELAAEMPRLRGRLLANQPLAPLTWFRVGGPAQLLFTPADEDDLAYFLAKLPSRVPVAAVGVGSNLIVRDGECLGAVAVDGGGGQAVAHEEVLQRVGSLLGLHKDQGPALQGGNERGEMKGEGVVGVIECHSAACYSQQS